MASRVLKAALLGAIASLASLAEADRKVAHVSPSLRMKLDEANSRQKLSLTKEPRVGISGYLYDWEETINIHTGTYGTFGFGISTILCDDNNITTCFVLMHAVMIYS